MKRVAAAIVTIGALGLPCTVQAHISLHPNTIPAGAFATLDVRVPGEQENAYVKKVDVLFPKGFTSVDYENVPGWTVKILNQKLASPAQTDDGPVSEEVSQIVWSWTGPLGRVSDNQFVDFPLSVAIPSDLAGKSLRFKTLQTYSNGQIVRWIDPSLEAEHPAPTINISEEGGAVQDVAGDEAGPRPDQLAPTTSSQTHTESSGGASKGIGIAALILGALALLTGLVALVIARRPTVSAGD
jgi:uncharacterized protein YcnI